MTIRTLSSFVSAAVLTVALSAGTNADHETSEAAKRTAAQERHAVMEIVGKSFGTLNKILKGEIEGEENIAVYASMIYYAAQLAPGAYSVDTRGLDVKTDAKDAIWENWDDFAERAGKFYTDAKAFRETAKTGDKAAIIAGVRTMGGNCKGCHDKYKED